MPSQFTGRIFYYGRMSPATRKGGNLENDIRRVLAPLMSQHPGVLLDSGASIIRMVGVALSLGLARVVFAGVDLNTKSYFWEDNPQYDLSKLPDIPSNNQRGHWSEESSSRLHETMNTTIRPFSVAEILGAFAPVLSQNFGLELFVSSPRSVLADFLPTFEWLENPK